MSRFLFLLFFLSSFMISGARADIYSNAVSAVSLLPLTTNGIPIAILTRSDNDLSEFYRLATLNLCDVTKDGWCETDLYSVLTDTTNILGWARILTYTSNTGASKKVCAILPPSSDVSPGTIASSLSGTGQIFDWRDLATSDEARSWLMLRYGGICEGTGGGTEFDTKKADSFASVALTLLEGSGLFVSASDITPSRKFSFYDGYTSTAWATNVGERVLLELWKAQVGSLISATGCIPSVVTSNDMNTTSIVRDTVIPSGKNCASSLDGSSVVGEVTDANLWLWTSLGQNVNVPVTWPVFSMPPIPYVPFMSFSSFSDGVSYCWNVADVVAKNY